MLASWITNTMRAFTVVDAQFTSVNLSDYQAALAALTQISAGK